MIPLPCVHDFSEEKILQTMLCPAKIATNQFVAMQNFMGSFAKYTNELIVPYLISTNYFSLAEQEKLSGEMPMDSVASYLELLEFNTDISARSLNASLKALGDYTRRELPNALEAMINTLFNTEGKEKIDEFLNRQAKAMDIINNIYPNAIRDIEPEYGFHFERGINPKIAETDRFTVYQVTPLAKGAATDNSFKPILIIPPYVLGANILGFLPNEQKSYAHCFANQGIPTYIRISKDISQTPALQTMTGENDALDTKYFCEIIKARHGKSVTLNGYCQGGFNAVCNVLSGELDGVVDALLTCVAPMDGTRSKGLADFLKGLPRRFNDLAYGTKTMPNGNKVADGKLMGWVYKLRSIENESPLVAFLRDMKMLEPKKNGDAVKINKTAAALNYWLTNERTDLPLGITKMSFASFNTPITEDGTLPVTLFGRKLNFKRIREKNMPWLICYGEQDDLVEKACALAPLDYIDVETSSFPKGHVAIATSWSNPKSECALHTRFGEKKYRGPVRFQMDLDEQLSRES
jgi:hypothetical protein